MIFYLAARIVVISARIRQNTVRVGDRDRTYLIYVPANLPQQAALVIVLHGSEMGEARMRPCTGYEFDRLADEHGFVVLYPRRLSAELERLPQVRDLSSQARKHR